MMKWVRSMTKTKTRSEQQKKPRLRFVFTWHDFGIFLSMLSFATILCYFLRTIDDSDVYVALIFELTVVLVSRFTDGYLFGLLSSVVGVIGINYIFTFPYYQLNFTISGYPLTFLVMLIVSVVVSTLTTQIKQQEKIRAEAEKEKMRGICCARCPTISERRLPQLSAGSARCSIPAISWTRRQERSFWKTSATSQIGW